MSRWWRMCVFLAALTPASGCNPPGPPGRHDLAAADLATPDLAAADLATRDLAVTDLAIPDLATPDLATPALVVVMPAALRGWLLAASNTAHGGFSSGPGTAPRALGGFRMQTGAGSGADLGGKAWLMTRALTATPLSQIDAMSYRSDVRPGSGAGPQLAVSMNLQVDLDGDGARDTTLVFEPVYAPEQGTVAPGQWQRWDAWRGRWWTTVATPAFCAAACTFTIPQLLAVYPSATLVDWDGMPSVALLAGQRSGGGWANFDGDVDEFAVSIQGVTRTYDFEPDAAACASGGYAASATPPFASEAACLAYHR